MGGTRRVLLVLVVVAAFGAVLGGAPAAAQDVERPGRGEWLDNVSVPGGETIEVDISAGFTGTVDTYSATSGDATVATVSVSGSVVSITGVSVGYAFVTVTATNAGGSRSQWFEVTVTPPPAPTLRYQLGAHATTIDAVVAFDLTPVFDGVVTSYTATSSDATILDASADESILVLRGVAAGAVTVTVTAHNGPGSTSVTFPVTVGAFAPPRVAAPQTAGALDAQEVPAGATTTIDVTGAFAGTIDDYLPITGDGAIVAAARPQLGTIQLTGVAAGTTTVRIVAINTGGITAQTLDVIVTEPVLPTITATAPTHCLTGEGTPTATGGREGIATIDIAYQVTGGIEPYVITNDATNITTTTPTGTINVACARPGIDIYNVAPDVNAVESGPNTITLTITDNNADTATTTVTIEIVEDAYTTEYEDGVMAPGSTYVIGDPEAWQLVTVPAGLDLQFVGVSQDVDYLFVESPSSSSIVIRSTTGTEISRHVRTTATTTRGASSTTRDVGALFDTLIGSIQQPAGISYARSAATYRNWHPYPLPPGTSAAIHPKLQRGGPLLTIRSMTNPSTTEEVLLPVCNGYDGSEFDVDTPLRAAVAAWNAATSSLGYTVFGIVSCDYADDLDADNVIIVNANDAVDFSFCGSGVSACARMYIAGNPPTIVWENPIFALGVITLERRAFEDELGNPTSIRTQTEILMHELGHYLGFEDYYDTDDPEPPTCAYVGAGQMSLYAFTILVDCAADTITPLDIRNLHSIYHPDVLRNIKVEKRDSFPPHYWVIEADLPTYNLEVHKTPNDPSDLEVYPEFNAYRYLVFWRDASSTDEYRFLKQVTPFGARTITLRDPNNMLVDATDKEFLVVGVTRGDVDRRVGNAALVNHATKLLSGIGDLSGEVLWTLGHPETVLGPMSPSALTLSADPERITEAPGASRSAVVTASLDHPALDTPATLQFSAAATSSASGSDYVMIPASGEVTIPVGEREATVTLEAINDDIDEQYESLHITATASDGGIDGMLTAKPLVLPIVDNDFTVSIAGDEVCMAGESVRLGAGASGDTEPTTFTWRGAALGSGEPLMGESVTFDCPAAGTYTITVSATDSTGGVGSAAHTLIASGNTGPGPNVFTVSIEGDAACTVSESVTLSAVASGDTEPTTFTWSSTVLEPEESTGETVTFDCPAAGTHTFTVSAVDSTGGVGSAAHTLIANEETTTRPPSLPDPPTVGAVGTTSVSLDWDDEPDADGYRLTYIGGGASVTLPVSGSSILVSRLQPWTAYSFTLVAYNSAGESGPSLGVPVHTSVSITGRVAAVKVTPNANGKNDVAFAFQPSGESRIELERRYVTYADMVVNRWVASSDVIRTVQPPSQTLGQINARLLSNGKIEVCFAPHGGTRQCPDDRLFPYATATLNRWLASDWFTFTITEAAAGARGAGDVPAMAAQPAGEPLPEWDPIEGRLDQVDPPKE